MWVKRSVPAIAGARFVVSDKGDILSPKYAPLMIAPATNPSDMPKVFPIPKRAIPIVAIVDQELPVEIETMALTTQAANRKMVGFNICKP